MMRKILSLHIFAALVCLVIASVASADCATCGDGGAACGGLLGRLMTGGGKSGGCLTCQQGHAPLMSGAIGSRLGCGANGMCAGNCGGTCGGKSRCGFGKGFLGMFSEGVPHSIAGGECRTCDNIWDDYCATKQNCLPHASYPMQNRGGCNTCGGACRGAGGCASGGCASVGGCTSAGCASAPMSVAPRRTVSRARGCGSLGCDKTGCDGGCAAAPPVVYAAPPVSAVAAPTPVVAPVAVPTPAEEPARTQPEPVAASEVAETKPAPAVATPSDTHKADPPIVQAESPVDGGTVDGITAEPVNDPIPPIPPSPVSEPELDDQTRTGAFDWMYRALRRQ